MKIPSLLLALIFGTALVHAENMIPNPSFEDVAPGGGISDWNPFSYPPPNPNPLNLVKAEETSYSLDSTIAKDGTHSAKISSTVPVRAAYNMGNLPILPGQKLHVSVWVKGQDIDFGNEQGAWVRLGLTNPDAEKQKVAYTHTLFLKGPSGTFDWTLLEGDVTIPPEAAAAQLELFLWQAKGTVWFDNVKVEVVDGPANPPGAMADPSQKGRYHDADVAVPPPKEGEKRVVFLGDSITDNWKLETSFPNEGFINRGIGGQRTIQMLGRFNQDVLALKPKVVWFLGGTNDLAGGSSPASITANIRSLIKGCKENQIAIIVTSILPVSDYHGGENPKFKRTELRPPEKIVEINRLLADLCREENVTFLDLHSVLVDGSGQMPAEFANDGLHPNPAGYAKIAPLVQKAIDDARAKVP